MTVQATNRPRDKAIAFAEHGRSLAAAVNDAVLSQLPDDYNELLSYAGRVRLCCQDSNIWTAEDLHTKKGECYDAAGRFWHCGHKLCPYCVARHSQRNRRRLREIIEQQKLYVGENYHFLTLTLPNQGIGLLEARKLFNDAWEVFRKRKWFRTTIKGGCKSEEFTLTKQGYHYHGHVLVRSKYISYSSFRHFWTESLKHSFRKNGRQLTIKTADYMAMANSKRVHSLSNAIKEVAKYITKTDTWKNIPKSDLLDICRIRRFPRMFEFFGTFKSSGCVAGEEQGQAESNKTILDTRSLSDAEKPTYWRGNSRRLGAVEYLTELQDKITNTYQIRTEQLKRHYPYASFKRLKPNPGDPIRVVVRLIDEINDRKRVFSPLPQPVNFKTFARTI